MGVKIVCLSVQTKKCITIREKHREDDEFNNKQTIHTSH